MLDSPTVVDLPVRRALLLAWLCLSGALLPVLLSPWLLPEATLFELAGRCKTGHAGGRTCPLCGMTRAFLLISRGQLDQAKRLNRASVPLYGGMVANDLLAAATSIFLVRRKPGS